jgi:hypothetical protein
MTWERSITKRPRKPLFHYTTIEGLIGIFRDKKIWATSVSHLNDKRELSIAIDMFKDTIRELAKRLGLSIEAASHPAGYKPDPGPNFLGSLLSIPDLALESQTFVCSFSEDGDQLSQWRGYCPGGHGFSIGFDYSRFRRHIDRQRLILEKCIYNPNKQRECIGGFVKEEIEPMLRGLTADNLTKRMAESMVLLFHVLPILKDKSFEEEKEWRIVSAFRPSGTRLKFRAGRMTLIPYSEFQLTDPENEAETLPIASICVGPSPNSAESLSAIKALLEQEKMSESVRVIPSRIPYREV